MSAKKISRKELLKSPDEFLTFWQKTFNFIDQHKKQFLAGVLVLVGILVASAITVWYLNYSAGRAVAAYNQAASQLPTDGQVEPDKAAELITALEKFRQDYSGSAPADYALLDLADLYYQQKEYKKSLAAYQEFLDDLEEVNEDLRPMILNGMAYAHEALGDFSQAATKWEEVLALSDDLLKEEAYLGLGRVFEAMAQPDEARRAYEELLAKYPASASVQPAKARLAELNK